MTTTPTLWGNEVTFSNFFTDFAPKVKALADGTFTIVWQRSGGDIVGRHLNEQGSFTGGDFLSALSASTTKALTDPQVYQQADGQIVVDYTESQGSHRDVRWHEVDRANPNSGSVGMEDLSITDEFLYDSTSLPEIGSAHVFGATSLLGGNYLILRFADLNGLVSSDRLIVDFNQNTDEQNGTVACNLNGVAVAYEQFDKSTFDRQVKLQIFQYNGAPLGNAIPVSGPGTNAGFPDITTLGNGSYLVTWQQNGGISFRNYSGAGTPLDNGPTVIPGAAGLVPKITALKDGGFMIAWTGRDGTESDGSADLDIFMQRFDRNGQAVGDRIHLDKPGDQGFVSLHGMSITTLADGRVVLTYESETGDSTNVTVLKYQMFDPRDSSITGTNGNDNIVGREDGAIISGRDGDDKLAGREAADGLDGGNGNDNLLGYGGNDVLAGGAGNDRLDGGAGVDTVNYVSAGSAVTVSLAVTTAQNTGGAGTDTISGVENLAGSSFDDRLTGSSGANVIEGGRGNDQIYGGAGNDSCYGGDGNDRIQGDAGADLMFGGSGADTFWFDDGHTGMGSANRDRIADFNRGQGDKLNVDPIDANLTVGGDQDFVFKGTAAFTGIGQIRVVNSGADRIIQFNNDKDMQADFEIVLQGFGKTVQASDFEHL